MDRPPGKLTDEQVLDLYDARELQRRFPDEGALLRYLYEHEELSLRRVALILGTDAKDIQRRMQKYGLPRRTVAQALVSYQGHTRRDCPANPCLRAYMIGFCVGDAHVNKCHAGGETIEVQCRTTKQEQVKLVKGLFEPFGYVGEVAPNAQGRIRLTAYLNMTFAFLLDLQDEIPAWILADDAAFFAFLAGYVDAEGHIGIDPRPSHHSAHLMLRSYDHQILHQAHAKLIELGIHCPSPRIARSKGYTTKQGFTFREDSWGLFIYAKGALMELFRRIAPYMRHAKRIRDMRKAIWHIEKRA